MTIKAHEPRILRALLLATCMVLLTSEPVQAKSKSSCDQERPETLCNAENTCGSVSSPCMVNITRSKSFANVKPGIPNAKNNRLFCIRSGTTVVWMSSKKQGFTVSFGKESPFDPDRTILGGGDKQVTTKAIRPGCYKYDVGAFTSGTVYGMSGGTKLELIIVP